MYDYLYSVGKGCLRVAITCEQSDNCASVLPYEHVLFTPLVSRLLKLIKMNCCSFAFFCIFDEQPQVYL